MRANLARTAIVAATIMALSGCRSGASSSGWNWGWNRKNAAASNPSLNTPSGPQLPSASATPPGFAPGNSATAQQGGTSGYAEQATAVGGAYPASAYPGQPTGYNNSASATNGMSNNAAPGTNYGAPPNSAAPNYGAPANNLAPQTGPYSDSYGQAAGQGGTTPNAYGSPAAGYPNSAGPNAPYQTSGSQVAADSALPTPAYPATAVDPNANTVPAAGGNPAPPANVSYGTPADPRAAGNSPAADNRYSNDQNAPNAAPSEQPAADRYAATPTDPVNVSGAGSSGATGSRAVSARQHGIHARQHQLFAAGRAALSDAGPAECRFHSRPKGSLLPSGRDKRLRSRRRNAYRLVGWGGRPNNNAGRSLWRAFRPVRCSSRRCGTAGYQPPANPSNGY